MKRKDFKPILRKMKYVFDKEPTSFIQDYYGEQKVTLIIKTKEKISTGDDKFRPLFKLIDNSYYFTIQPQGEYISIKLKIELNTSYIPAGNTE